MADETEIEERDPLDGLFDGPEDTVKEEPTAVVEETAAEDDKKTEGKQEEPAEGADETIDHAGVKMVPYAALAEARKTIDTLRTQGATAKPATETPAADVDEDDPFGLGPMPDKTKDPVAYTEFLTAQTNLTIINDRLNRSEKDARRDYKDQAGFVDTIKAWALARFDKDTAFTQRVMLAPDPYEEAISIYNEEKDLTALKELPEEVRSGLSAEELEMIKAHRAKSSDGGSATQPRETDTGRFTPAGGTPRSRSPAAPSASLVKASPAAGKGGSGAHAQAVGDGVAFDDTFK